MVYAERAALPHNFRCEVDFVVRRANTRAELDDDLGQIGPEERRHLRNCIRDDAELGAFASGMDQTDGRRFRIDNVNGTAVCDIDAQRDTAFTGNEPIAAGEFAAHIAAAAIVDNCDLISVDLLSSKQRPIAHSDCIANFAVGGFEPLQYFDLIGRNIDSWNSSRKNVTTDAYCV